jgi:hypothetical protein
MVHREPHYVKSIQWAINSRPISSGWEDRESATSARQIDPGSEPIAAPVNLNQPTGGL